MKKCPFCAEEIQDDAIKCRFCNEFLEDAPPPKPKISWIYRTSTFMVAVLCAGPFALPLAWINPHYNVKKKIVITLIVGVISYYLGMVVFNAFKSIGSYYDVIFTRSIS